MKNLPRIKLIVLSMIICLTYLSSSAQSRRIKKLTKEDREAVANEEDEKKKATFPEVLTAPYPENSIGSILQREFKAMAINCGIKRDNERNYVPTSIRNNYGGQINNEVFGVEVSTGNLLCLVLKDSEIVNLTNLKESSYIGTSRIMGLFGGEQDPFFPNYAEAQIVSPPGFMNFVHSKNCSGFYEANAGVSIKPPVVEVTTSIQADASFKSSLTTISAQFNSPLKLLLDRNDFQSIYAHMLLWRVYRDDFNQKEANTQENSNELLINKASYLSEFKGVGIFSSTGTTQGYEINSRVSAGYGAGIFNASGQVSAGTSTRSTFKMENFLSYLYKPSGITKTFSIDRLPDYNMILAKFQTSESLSEQIPYPGKASHRIPIVLSKTLYGIPSFMCEGKWNIGSDFQKDVWVAKPEVKSRFNADNNIPKCICEISGNLKQSIIESSLEGNKILSISYTLENLYSVGAKKLFMKFSESIGVTSSPNLTINPTAITVSRKKVTQDISQTQNFEWKVSAFIVEDGVRLKSPVQISRTEIVFSPNFKNPGIQISDPQINGNSITFTIESNSYPLSNVPSGKELTIPMAIRIYTQLSNNSTTAVVTQQFNLSIPELNPPVAGGPN